MCFFSFRLSHGNCKPAHFDRYIFTPSINLHIFVKSGTVFLQEVLKTDQSIALSHNLTNTEVVDLLVFSTSNSQAFPDSL